MWTRHERTEPARPAPRRGPASTTTPDTLAALQRTAGNAAVAAAIQRSGVHEVLRARGRPLDESLRTDMEQRLGADFSDVRLHTDAAAQRSAAAVGAHAYTSGSHVILGAGTLDRHTLAHELTHVIQQRQGPVAGTDHGDGLSVSDPNDPFERAAEANARRVMSARSPIDVGHAGPEDGGTAAHQQLSVQRIQTDSEYDPKYDSGDETGSGREEPKKKKPKTELKKRKRGPEEKEPKKKKPKTNGITVAEALQKELVNLGWKQYGHGRTLTMHKPTETDNPSERAKAENLNKNKRAEIYGNTANLKESRQYPEKERSRQSIRWITTLALNYLKNLKTAPEEVQGTAHEGKLYISANRNSANEALRELAKEKKTGTAFLEALIEKNSPEALDRRGKRHRSKADSRLTGKKAMSNGYESILSALSKKVEVPAKVDKNLDGLHAERRLDKQWPGAVTPSTTAGTKRPCVACYVSLYVGTDISPGPYWPSQSANRGFVDYTVENAEMLAHRIDEAVTKAGGTFASLELLCADAKAIAQWDCNTDSESEASDDNRTDTSTG